MAYTIEYSSDGQVRVSDEDFQTDWMPIPADGQFTAELGEKGEEVCLYVTTKGFDGVLGEDTVSILEPLGDTEVADDVDPAEVEDEDEEDGEGSGDGEEGDEEDPDEL